MSREVCRLHYFDSEEVVVTRFFAPEVHVYCFQFCEIVSWSRTWNIFESVNRPLKQTWVTSQHNFSSVLRKKYIYITFNNYEFTVKIYIQKIFVFVITGYTVGFCFILRENVCSKEIVFRGNLNYNFSRWFDWWFSYLGCVSLPEYIRHTSWVRSHGTPFGLLRLSWTQMERCSIVEELK